MAEVRVSIPWTTVPDIFENEKWIFIFKNQSCVQQNINARQ